MGRVLIALIIAAAVAVLALIGLVQARTTSKEIAATSNRRVEEVTSSRDRVMSDLETTEADLAQVRSELTERTSEAERFQSDLETAQAEVARLEDEAAEQKSSLTSVNEQLDSANARVAELIQQSADHEIRIAALVDDRDRLQADVDAARGETETAKGELVARSSRPDVVLTDAVNAGTLDPTTLWQLEMARAERRWRNSVSTNPESDPSPFDDVDDPVRLAVEVEAAALREEVGAFITIDWQAGFIEDPARRILVLRVAQEVLAAAAREPEPSCLRVGGEDDVSIKLVAVEEGDAVANIALPRITSDLIDMSDGGVDITVRSAS